MTDELFTKNQKPESYLENGGSYSHIYIYFIFFLL